MKAKVLFSASIGSVIYQSQERGNLEYDTDVADLVEDPELVVSDDDSDIEELSTEMRALYRFRSEEPYNRFLRANRDLAFMPVNMVKMETLLGTNSGILPTTNVLEGIPQTHIDKVMKVFSTTNDFEKLLQNLRTIHGPLFTVEGPAGTGKSYAMLALAMMDIGGNIFKYPVHSQDFPRDEWCSLVIDWQKSSQNETAPINVYNKNTMRQVILMAGTNAVADSLTIASSKR